MNGGFKTTIFIIFNQTEMMIKLYRVLFYLVIGFSFFLYLFYAEYDRMPAPAKELNQYLFTLVASLSSGLIITRLNAWLNVKIPWRRHVLVRFIVGLVSDFMVLGACLILLGYISSVIGLISYDIFPDDMMEKQLEIKLMVLSLITLFVVTLVEFNGYSYNQYSVGQIRKLRAERKQLELQFEALKSQLSPHYLFNSMNTISSLVYRDKKIAEAFIRNLADTFNYVLRTKEVRVVSIKEELEALKDYRYLLTIRYGVAIKIDIKVSDDFLERPIPPLTLQLLVENAVKHNVISNDSPLNIHITAHNKELCVSNNKTDTPLRTDSHRVGLANIKKRYAYFTQKAIVISDEAVFQVKLPMLTDEN